MGRATPGFVWTLSSRSVVSAGEATVPVTAPGVLFGETMFETLRARHGTFFRLNDHLARLRSGIEALGWGRPTSDEQIQAGLRTLLETDDLAQEDDLRVRITALRIDDRDGLEYVIHAQPYRSPTDEQYANGVDAVVTSLRLDGAAPWANLKTGHRLAHRLAGVEARQAGAWEGILLNTDGMLADGTISNVHFVINGSILTPSPRCGALPGITQMVVRRLAEQRNIRWNPGAYPPEMLAEAGEAFLTNALIGLMPLVRVDGARIGDGKPGPVTASLSKLYAELVAKESRPPG